MTLTRCRNREKRITMSKIWDNVRSYKRHSRPVDIEEGSGSRSVKWENVGTHKWDSPTVEIDKGSGLRSVKCEAVETHKRHSRPVEVEKGSGLRSIKCENVGTHKRQSRPVDIERGSYFYYLHKVKWVMGFNEIGFRHTSIGIGLDPCVTSSYGRKKKLLINKTRNT